jgi:outer membrane protein assembly factor BamB
MTVIELGEPGTEWPPGPVERQAGRRDLRRFVVSVLAVLCAATMTGSAPPGPALLRSEWSVPISQSSRVSIVRNTVFVLAVDAGAQITAYDLADGAVRWSRRLTVSRTWMTAEEPGAVMVPIGRTVVRYVNGAGQRVIEGVTEATVALDVLTGAEMWRLPGDVVHSTPETALLAEPGATVRQVRIADGAVLWTRTVPGAESWAVAGREQRSARIVAVSADGRVEVLRLADGSRTSAGRVPISATGRADDGLGADAGVLYLSRSAGGHATVTAYDLDTLNPRWRISGDYADGTAHACGVVMCLDEGTAITGLDPATGEVVWRAPGWTNATAVAGENRLVADRRTDRTHGLLDSTTGALVADLGAGLPIWDYTGSRPTVLLRDTVSPSGRTAVSRVDPRTGELQPRGTIDGVGFPGCGAVGDRLVCGTADGRLAVTAVG